MSRLIGRRRLLTGGVAVGALAAAGALLRPRDHGQPHTAYFRALQAELRAQGFMRPSMIIDLDALDHNIEQVTTSVQQGEKALRLVAKSLPSPQLLAYIAERANTRRLMSFHQPFLCQDAEHMPDANILLGKPMPVAMAAQFYRDLRGAFDPVRQLQWLIDSPARLTEYRELAMSLGQPLNINIELDVGLHRGGVPEGEAGNAVLAAMLRMLTEHPEQLRWSGFMGYEPHVVKLPSVLGSSQSLLAKAMATYQQRIDQVQQQAPMLWQQALAAGMTLNTAGSPTYRLHEHESIANELAVGSGLLKPTDFDLPSLASHVPAAFIATPVLKKTPGLQLPGLEAASRAYAWWDVNAQEAAFLYGGHWLAQYVSPQGIAANGLYGHSSNQELALVSPSAGLQVNDLVFLRPTQSEAVLLQFGELVVVRNRRIVDTWPVYSS